MNIHLNDMSNFKIFNFSEEQRMPEYRINKSGGFIQWGDDNLYPDFLLEILNFKGSNLHQAIINRKVKMMTGSGVVETPSNSVYLQNEYNDDSLNSIVFKIGFDYEIFNGFAYEVIWSNDGSMIAEINHIPFHNVRVGAPDEDGNITHYLMSADWTQTRKAEYKPVMIPKYNPESRQGSQLVYYVDYNPMNRFYPTAYYSNAINYISLHYEISNFHIQQAKNGYAPSFVLNMTTASIPTEEEMAQFKREFDKEYKGTENAGKMILTFSENEQGAPTLIPITANDSDDRFLNLSKEIFENILTAHQVTSPELFGIYVPGSLGNKNNLIESLDIFNSVYVKDRAKVIEDNLTEVLGVTIEIERFELDDITSGEESEDVNAEAQANLRGSIGGVQGLIEIQQSVEAGTTSRSSAQATLELIYGFTPEEAERLLGDVQEDNDNDEEIKEE